MTKFLLFLLSTLLAAGAEYHQASGDAAFEQVANDYIDGYLRWRPLTAVSLGLHQYDGKLTDYSHASIEIELTRLKSFERRLSEMETRTLGPDAFYDFRILRNSIRREIFGFEDMKQFTDNPMTYSGAIDVNVYIKRDFAPLENRVRSIVSILKQAPKVMAAARENLVEVLPRPQVETAIESTTGGIDFLSKDLVTAVQGIKDEALMAEFKQANDAAIEEAKKFAAWLKDEKLPKANAPYALGHEKYIKMLACGEMIQLPPEQLLQIGLKELKRKQQVFADTARLIDPKHKPIEVFKAIQKDHPTEQTLIPDTAKNLDAIRDFVVNRQLITLPSQVRAQVKETPQYLRATSFASMDTPGPFEVRGTEAYYYVTPVEPDWSAQQKEEWLTAFNYYTTDVVSIHEAYPGHYVQFLCLKASPATRIEKIFQGYAFTEGWAHYAEQMMIDQGFGGFGGLSQSQAEQLKMARYRLAQTDEALLRVCRLCVSLKMHTEGMNVADATKFFVDNCYYEEKPAHSEAVRGAYDPEFLYYTLGKLEIFKLRDDYQKQERSRFSLQKFHDEMLKHGSPPIRLLREKMLKDKKLWPETF